MPRAARKCNRDPLAARKVIDMNPLNMACIACLLSAAPASLPAAVAGANECALPHPAPGGDLAWYVGAHEESRRYDPRADGAVQTGNPR